MISVKQIIHFTDTNSVEVTWIDSDTDKIVRCNSYDQYQLDILQADLGDGSAMYESTYEAVRENWKAPAPTPIVIPQSVSKACGIAAMQDLGVWSSVKGWFENHASENERDLFGAITEFDRASPLLGTVQSILEMSNEQVDQLFILAASKSV